MIQAIAIKSGYTTSAVSSAAYTIEYPAATPIFNVSAGTYNSIQTVSISDATTGVTIYYTTNGTAPTTSSTVYSTPITVSSSETIEAIAAGNGYSVSPVATAVYTITLPAATPTFSPGQGTYSSVQTVNIIDTTSGTTIYYTIDGTAPTTSSTVYSGAITVSATETLEAIATAGGYSTSAVATAAYTIIPPAGTPTFSVPAGAYATAQVVTISDTTPSSTIFYTTNGTTPTTSSTVYSGSITVPSSETIEAIATASNYSTSTAASAGYFITPLAVSGKLEWTWMGGSSTLVSCGVGEPDECAPPGVYGTLGVPGAGNIPGGREEAASWTDSGGNLWLFGGLGDDATGNSGYLNDLWEFSPSKNEWAWMGGSSTLSCTGPFCFQRGVYGTLGVPGAGNIPGGRYGASTWTDTSGNFWLFGGQGYDATGNSGGALNDLWKFNPSTSEWTWMGGSSTLPTSCAGNTTMACGQPGVYGTLGTSASGNNPGGRNNAASWTDSGGNLWLFGGQGLDVNGTYGWLNDLWEFNLSTSLWTWMGGSRTVDQPGMYGTLGTPAAGNIPGARTAATIWRDSSGNLWLFGGGGYDVNGVRGDLNDLWEFNPSTKEWAWLGGSSSVGGNFGQPAVYGTLGVSATGNTPGGRYAASSWIDGIGNFWLFGGTDYNANGNGGLGELNDLWEFNPSTKEWAWMGGSISSTIPCAPSDPCGQPGVYGALGVPAVGNIPGGRWEPSTWTDRSGNLWLFGGQGFDANGIDHNLNDVWRYQPTTATVLAAATPTFNVAAGTYTSAQTVTISDTTPFATIYYTTNGTTPTTSSAVYSGPISVSSTETLEAIATAGGYSTSAVATAAYIINLPQAATPTFSVAAGTYASAQTVAISDTTPSAIIYYTTTGTTPTTGSAVYSAPITVSSTETLEAIATASGYSTSAVQSATYTITPKTAPTVTVTPSSTSITTAQALTVTTAVSGGTGKPTPTGTVTLTSGTFTSAASTLSSGGATINVPAGSLAIGSDTLTVSYTPDSSSSSTYNSATGSNSVTVTTAVNPTFTVSGTAVTVAPGATTGNTSTITVTPTGGFTGNVTLTATSNYPSADPAAPTFSFGTTSPVNITGASAGTATLTITTTASSTSGCTAVNLKPRGVPWYAGGSAVLACVLLFGIPARRRRWLTLLGMMALLVALSSGVLACGGGGGGGGCTPTNVPGTTAGTYTITVTGTSSATTATGTVTLTVQ